MAHIYKIYVFSVNLDTFHQMLTMVKWIEMNNTTGFIIIMTKSYMLLYLNIYLCIALIKWKLHDRGLKIIQTKKLSLVILNTNVSSTYRKWRHYLATKIDFFNYHRVQDKIFTQPYVGGKSYQKYLSIIGHNRKKIKMK